MKKNNPIRHHYIPQFVLKHFCYEENEIWFYDIKTGNVESKNVKDVFMEKNLYKDEMNDEDELEIERNFAKYEAEVSTILAKQFYDEKLIYIIAAEQESIKLFFALMGFRSKNTAEYFQSNCKDLFESFYINYQTDGDFDALWKRNLKELTKCRSYEEVHSNPLIDEPFKLFMLRDTTGLLGSYLKIIESENEDFIISDAYPLVLYASGQNGEQINSVAVYPISPKRAILIIFNFFYVFTDFSNAVLPKGVYTKPSEKNGMLEFRVKRLKDERVVLLNNLIKRNAKIGIGYKEL